MMIKYRVSKKVYILLIIGILFILINMLTAIQAYRFTHFEESIHHYNVNGLETETSSSFLKAIFKGIDNPRPYTKEMPDQPYESVIIPAGENKSLSGWILHTDSVKHGIVLLFHGYTVEKSSMLDYAYEILDMGYDVLLVDFMGAGESYGNKTTIGYHEAENVKITFDYAKEVMKEENIFLMGFSMGAAAILKAQHDYHMPVKGIICEASYGRMLDTIRVRVKMMGFGVFTIPATYMFSFWNSIINDINVFEMNPEEYANSIAVPTLIACGGKDQYIPMEETTRIFENLPGRKKTLKFYPECIHELYHIKYPKEWYQTVYSFLKNQ